MSDLYPAGHPLHGMTQLQWDNTPPHVRERIRDNSGLKSELIGHEGKRVECTYANGSKRRFWVGKSTGWRPCHLEIKTSRSRAGDPAETPVRVVVLKNRH